MSENEALLPSPETSPETRPAFNIRHSYKSCFSFIEISTFLFALYVGMCISLDTQYIRYRMIDKLSNDTLHNQSTSVHNSKIMKEVDQQTSMLIIYQSFAALIPSCIILTTLPSYSDTNGRKFSLVIPLIGFFIHSCIQVSVVYFKLDVHIFIFSCFIKGSLGDVPTLFTGIYAYLSETTSHNDRSFRMIVLDIFLGTGTMISQISIGYIITKLGFFSSYLILFSTVTLNLLYVLFILIESVNSEIKTNFFSMFHIKKSFKIFFSKSFRGANTAVKRLVMVICLCICSILWLSVFCKDNALTLYLMDSPFFMSSVVIGYFGAFQQLVPSICNVFLSKLLHKHVGDTGLVIVGTISSFAFCLALAFFRSSKTIFIAPFFGLGFMVAIPMIRSICSKLVLPEDEGAMFSVISLCMSLSLIVGMSGTTYVYAATVKLWPPFVFIYMAAFCLIAVILSIVLFVYHRRVGYTTVQTEVN